MKSQNKIFYLGFHKTGTTSFGALMQKLGFSRQSYYKPYSTLFITKLEQNDLDELFEVSDSYEAFEDDPWYLFYTIFENKYPNAKFVFYERNAEDWYQSCLYFFGRSSFPMNEFIFGRGKGSPLFNKDHHINTYKQHSIKVRNYFKDKPDKFLEIPDLSDRSAEEVSKFVGRGSVGISFPRENVNKLSKFQKYYRLSKMSFAKTFRLRERYIKDD